VVVDRPLSPTDVGRDRAGGRGRRDMPGERAQDAANVLRVPDHGVGPREVHPAGLVGVPAQDDLRLVGGAVE